MEKLGNIWENINHRNTSEGVDRYIGYDQLGGRRKLRFKRRSKRMIRKKKSRKLR